MQDRPTRLSHRLDRKSQCQWVGRMLDFGHFGSPSRRPDRCGIGGSGALSPVQRASPHAIGSWLIFSQSWEPIPNTGSSIPSIHNGPDGSSHSAAVPHPPSFPVLSRQSRLARSIHSAIGIMPLSGRLLARSDTGGSESAVGIFVRRTGEFLLTAGFDGHPHRTEVLSNPLEVRARSWVLVAGMVDVTEVDAISEVKGRAFFGRHRNGRETS